MSLYHNSAIRNTDMNAFTVQDLGAIGKGHLSNVVPFDAG